MKRNWFWLLVFLAFSGGVSSCISKKKYSTYQAYNSNLQSVVSDWYQAELQKLNSERQKKIGEVAVLLPEYEGIKNLEVVLTESLERIDKEYTQGLIRLDSSRTARVNELTMKIKGIKLP